MSALKGRTALITGVSRVQGIGFGIANRLAQQGADLFLHAYSGYDAGDPIEHQQDREEILRSLQGFGVRVEHLEANFVDPEAPVQVMNTALGHFGHIDILIINHTYGTWTPLESLTAEEIDLHLHINIRASLLLIREFTRQHDGRPGGRIVLMTSGQDLGPMSRELAYVASKGALHQLTKSVSDLLVRQGITVNTVNPGPTLTWTPGPEEHEAVLARMPQGRWGQPDDAARLITWLASDEAQWITGQVIHSEGGFRRE